MSVWKYRHESTGLLGSHINLATGEWRHRESGIGGSIDSFYEYLAKSWIAFGDDDYGFLFEEVRFA
jgi:hypothetical protein